VLVVTAAVVTVVALLARLRHGAGAAGVAVPLLVLAPAAHLAGGHPAGSAATAALCTLAWLLAGPARWPRAVAVWTGVVVALGLLSAAPLYLDSATASGTVTVVFIGAIWPAAYLTAWTTRDRLAGRAAVPALTTGVPGR